MGVTVRAPAGRRAGLRIADVRADARALLAAMNETASELSVVLVDDGDMRRLNRTYRGADRPTDVLAFAMREGQRIAGDEGVLGDIVISVDTASRQARRRRRALAAEVRTLVIHGLLHLLGYDHERSAIDARRMSAKERALARRLTTRPRRNG